MKTKLLFIALIIFSIINISFDDIWATSRKNNEKLLSDDTVAYVIYSGKVIDKDTRKPVVFANVYLNHSGIGTVTNSEGEFIIKVPKNSKANEITITFLGYKNEILQLSKLKNEQNIITLQSTPIPIDEVVIRNSDPKELVRKALASIKYNYTDYPEMQKAFYRETIKQNRSYVLIAEAVLDVYKTSYTDLLSEDRIKIFKGRKSQDVKRMDTILFKFQGGPRTSYLLDLVKNPNNLLDADMLQYYDFKLTGLTKINDRDAYIIEFDQKDIINYPLYQGKIYLDVKSLAFACIDFKYSEKGLALVPNELVRKKPVSMKINVENGNYLVNYREVNGKWYFNHVRSEIVFKCKWDKKMFWSNYVTGFEMAVTDRDSSNITKFNIKESAKMSDVLADKINYFADNDFWGDYNFIKPDESIESAIIRLNRKLKIRQ
jgi:hypothetical protein